MRPEDMNTINKDGKAFNGNYGAVAVAYGFLGALALGLIVAAIQGLL